MDKAVLCKCHKKPRFTECKCSEFCIVIECRGEWGLLFIKNIFIEDYCMLICCDRKRRPFKTRGHKFDMSWELLFCKTLIQVHINTGNCFLCGESVPVFIGFNYKGFNDGPIFFKKY